MTVSFRAEQVQVLADETHAFLGLASGADDPGHKVLLMRALTEDGASDILTGDAYFEYRDPSTGGYGCIAQADLGPDKLVLTCNKRRCPQLPDTMFEIDLAAVADRRADIATVLGKLIDGRRLTIED